MQFLKFGGGRRFYAKDFRNAYQFRPDVAPPRQKFQGYINFVPNRALLTQDFLGLMGCFQDNLQLRTRLSSLIRTAQLPEVSINTEVKNVYNRKRVITTGREYAPINLTIFDTIQNEWLTLLMKYFTYHFRDPTNKFNTQNKEIPEVPEERAPSTEYEVTLSDVTDDTFEIDNSITVGGGDTGLPEVTQTNTSTIGGLNPLKKIASRTGKTEQELQAANPGLDFNTLGVGDKVVVPGDVTQSFEAAQSIPKTPEQKRDIIFEINNDSLIAYNTRTEHATNSSKKGFDSDAFGYSPSYNKNFFERIDIILYHGNKGVQYSLINPTITTINFGDIDYSDSGFKDFNLSVQYEYFTVVDELNFNLGEADLSRFERMDGIKLPGSRNAKQPIALDSTSIEPIMHRSRSSQVFTQFSEEDVEVSREPFPYYNAQQPVSSGGAESFLDKVGNFLDDSPFGRILDRGLSAAVNGGDVKDALLGGLTNEVVVGITDPNNDTIFGPNVNLQVDLGDVVSDGINSAATGLGWRPDSGSDEEGDGGT